MQPQTQSSAALEQNLPRGEVIGLIGVKDLVLGYLNMPKAACTTIKNILYYLHNGAWLDRPLNIHRAIRHRSVLLTGSAYSQNREHLEQLGKTWCNFTFVRNPGARAFSVFVEKIWATGPYSFPDIRHHLLSKGALTLPPLESGAARDTDSVASNFLAFLDFVADNLARRTRFPFNPHWCVQSQRIKAQEGRDLINYIGRVETFSENMDLVLRMGGYTGPSLGGKRFNEGPKPPFRLSDIIDDRIAHRLWDIYSEDYEAFGYGDPRQHET